MNQLSKEDYLRLLEQYANDQYGNEDPILNIDDFQDAWIPAESPAKERMITANAYGSIDLTNVKKEKIIEALYKCTNLKIGNFLIKITRYSGQPDKNNQGPDLTMDVSIWEDKFKTPSGNPCKMTYRVNFKKDTRFDTRPWAKLFGNGSASKVPNETVIDIIRWMQALNRMTAFL